MLPASHIETCLFADDGKTSNNSELSLILMRRTEAADAGDPAAWFEQRFIANGWSGTWRWGIYLFQHFHTNTHEVLGVSRGSATLMLGGEQGTTMRPGVASRSCPSPSSTPSTARRAPSCSIGASQVPANKKALQPFDCRALKVAHPKRLELLTF